MIRNFTLHKRIGYSKKGWTDGEIGVEWIKQFDKHTKEKADGQDRLLLVDGHNSHYTRGFLRYARIHRIHILCYPAHGTHVYQGLDVVIFATLKHCWSEERDKWEREHGEGITKQNFLTIYGHAHIRALTPDIIRTAFRKTGVWPFNRNVITAEMMAPSKETSCEGHLPITPSSPVRIIAGLLEKLSANEDIEEAPNSDTISDSERSITTQSMQSDIELLIQQLQGTSLSGLVLDKPITSATRLQHGTAHPISPVKNSDPLRVARTIQPKTSNEVLLLASLRESEAANITLKRRVIKLQAANVLNEMYCNMLRGQLAKQEEKGRKGKGKGKLMGDGLPRLLSSDEFYEKVVVCEEAQKKAVADKKSKKAE